MDFTDFTAGENDSQRRLDKIAKRIFEAKGIESSKIQQLIRKKLIRVNNNPGKIDDKIVPGDTINIASFLLEKAKTTIHEQKILYSDLNVNTLFKNKYLWIINKNAGINVHRSSKDDNNNLADFILNEYKKNPHEESLSFIPGPLHRIDRGTSGIVVFSQNQTGAKWFNQAMKEHKIKKTYIGIVEGKVQQQMHWEDYLDKNEDSEGFHTIKQSSLQKKENLAITNIFPILYSAIQNLTLVQFNIITGKKHQIRCQSSLHGHPLYGDTAYGGKANKNNSFYLHAYKIRIPENDMEIPEEITAETGKNFNSALEKFFDIKDSSIFLEKQIKN